MTSNSDYTDEDLILLEVEARKGNDLKIFNRIKHIQEKRGNPNCTLKWALQNWDFWKVKTLQLEYGSLWQNDMELKTIFDNRTKREAQLSQIKEKLKIQLQRDLQD